MIYPTILLFRFFFYFFFLCFYSLFLILLIPLFLRLPVVFFFCSHASIYILTPSFRYLFSLFSSSHPSKHFIFILFLLSIALYIYYFIYIYSCFPSLMFFNFSSNFALYFSEFFLFLFFFYFFYFFYNFLSPVKGTMLPFLQLCFHFFFHFLFFFLFSKLNFLPFFLLFYISFSFNIYLFSIFFFILYSGFHWPIINSILLFYFSLSCLLFLICYPLITPIDRKWFFHLHYWQPKIVLLITKLKSQADLFLLWVHIFLNRYSKVLTIHTYETPCLIKNIQYHLALS